MIWIKFLSIENTNRDRYRCENLEIESVAKSFLPDETVDG